MFRLHESISTSSQKSQEKPFPLTCASVWSSSKGRSCSDQSVIKGVNSESSSTACSNSLKMHYLARNGFNGLQSVAEKVDQESILCYDFTHASSLWVHRALWTVIRRMLDKNAGSKVIFEWNHACLSPCAVVFWDRVNHSKFKKPIPWIWKKTSSWGGQSYSRWHYPCVMLFIVQVFLISLTFKSK